MNPEVDNYLAEGCGRCPLGGTPGCKVNNWRKELILLRGIVLDCGLTEEVKWGAPCYTFGKANVAMVAALKDSCVLSFFKGALLSDPHGILEKPGENTQAGRVISFTNVQEITEKESILKTYLYEAVEVEKAGLKVEFKKNPEPVPEEFQRKMDQDPELKAAFEALTPGRQRGYLLHFSQPKQSKTREDRIDKCIPQILEGIGLNDHYSRKKN